MGQKAGKAMYKPEASLFLNLSLSALEALWEAFNDVADGFGITLMEMQQICGELAGELRLNRAKLDERVQQLFVVFDDDENRLVDAIEFLSTIAVASGMTIRDKLEYVFNCYDFDGSQQLTIDEVTLAMKCTLSGLCKLSGTAPPRGAARADGDERLHARRALGDVEDPRARRDRLLREDPESLSWLEHYDSPDEQEVPTYEPLDHEIDYAHEGAFAPRGGAETAANEHDRFEARPPIALGAAAEAAEAARLKAKKDVKAKDSSEPLWVKTVGSLVPSKWSNMKPDLSMPPSTLTLEWVHGYRGEDCKNNVRYSADGEVVFHAGRVGVVCVQRARARAVRARAPSLSARALRFATRACLNRSRATPARPLPARAGTTRSSTGSATARRTRTTSSRSRCTRAVGSSRRASAAASPRCSCGTSTRASRARRSSASTRARSCSSRSRRRGRSSRRSAWTSSTASPCTSGRAASRSSRAA